MSSPLVQWIVGESARYDIGCGGYAWLFGNVGSDSLGKWAQMNPNHPAKGSIIKVEPINQGKSRIFVKMKREYANRKRALDLLAVSSPAI